MGNRDKRGGALRQQIAGHLGEILGYGTGLSIDTIAQKYLDEIGQDSPSPVGGVPEGFLTALHGGQKGILNRPLQFFCLHDALLTTMCGIILAPASWHFNSVL